ncbi:MULTISPECIES: hypothetical protein [unclassified Bradyrhizobium]|uniref:hypothetical protein n=1 Tax=unclassified Bradyrhizobium TaxID=2631580 RepID=UPI0028E8F59C|nr:MULTISPECIES: hypothetical protein [unclassified Bradyrhizobium]
MNNSDLPTSKTTRPSPALRAAESIPGRTLRALIPLVPYVGESISVLVEAQLSAHQGRRIDELFERVAQLENTKETAYSDLLLEKAINIARKVDLPKVPLLAKILYDAPEQDPSEVIRSHLLDICETLTSYELALLASLSELPNSARPSLDLATTLHEIRLNTPDMKEIHDFSLDRLRLFQLINQSDQKTTLTRLGQKFISIIIE